MFDRLDPELVPFVRAPLFDLSDVSAARQLIADLAKARTTSAPDPDVVQEDVSAVCRADGSQLRLRVYRAAVREAVSDYGSPCLYWIHGGGYVMGSMDQDDKFAADLVRGHGCTVVSVDWRHAPEHPFPAAADDCYAGLSWTFREASALGINPRSVVIGGHSSGGGSAASLALMVRDRGEFNVALMLLIAPMLDDRGLTASSQRVTDERVWNRANNETAWAMYLGDSYGTDDVSPYAAPSRATDLRGVAPCFLGVGELDLFVDEGIQYAMRLIESDVSTELHVYRGAHHGFPSQAPQSRVAQSLLHDVDNALHRAWTEPTK